MATSLAHDTKYEDWTEPRAMHGRDSAPGRAQLLLLTFFGTALLGAFLLLVAEDYPLRTLIAVQ